MKLFRRCSTLSVCLLALAGFSFAQQAVNLKKRILLAPDDLQAYQLGPLLPRHSGRSHYLIQFLAPPSPQQIQDLRGRGATITSYVPDAALVVNTADDSSWDGLGLRFVGRLDELDKLSPQLADQSPDDDGATYVVVEFHRDVDMDQARALALERDVQAIERDNLLPSQLLL